MSRPFTRRTFLLSTGALLLTSGCASWVIGHKGEEPRSKLNDLEKDLNGRIGVYALDTGSGRQFGYRAGERFPFCSTFKIVAAGAILARARHDSALLHRRIHYAHADLVTYSPITEQHLTQGMTIAELCAAALQYSDNTAGNILIDTVGGPDAVTAFARSIGDDIFRLDRRETELNTAIPADPRDTTTPAAMARTLQRLAFGETIGPAQRAQLQAWMRGNTTGQERIAAALPAGWQIGDKTGTGDYGTANDIAILYPPGGAPVILAIYTTQGRQSAKADNGVIAASARVAVDWLRYSLA